MKKQILFTVIVASTILNSFAQSNTFSKVYYSQTENYQGYALTKTFDKGYLVAGTTATDFDFPFVMKIDSSGALFWSKKITASKGRFTSVVATHDSCFVLVGDIWKDGSGKISACCVKINAKGDTLWSTGINESNSSTFYSVQQTYDHGFIAAGYISSSTKPYSKILVTKLDSLGVLEWNTVVSSGNQENYAYSIKQTPDSGYVVNTFIENYPPFDGNAALVKLSSLGKISWAKKYNKNTPVSTHGLDIQVTPSGLVSLLAVDNSLTLLKTDFLGNMLWVKEYSTRMESNCLNCITPKITKTADGGFVIVSGTGADHSWGQSVFKTDSLGNVVWSKDFILNALDVVENSDSGVTVIGNGPLLGVMPKQEEYPYNRSSPGFNKHIAIVRTDSLGDATICVHNGWVNTYPSDSLISDSILINQTFSGQGTRVHSVIANCSLTVEDDCTFWIGINEITNKNNISIAPNPFTFQTIISLEKEVKNATLQIIDVLGKELRSVQFSGKQVVIDRDDLPTGMYIVQVVDSESGSNEIIARAKIVIQ